MRLSAELAGSVNALCLSFPLVAGFGLKVLWESREGPGGWWAAGRWHQAFGRLKSYSGPQPGRRVEPLESICWDQALQPLFCRPQLARGVLFGACQAIFEVETFRKGADLECGSAVFVLLGSCPAGRAGAVPARQGLEEPRQQPRAVGQRWSLTAKRIFPAAFHKKILPK